MNRYVISFFLLFLSLSVSAQKVILSNELLPISGKNNTTVYCEKDSRKPLQGEWRIKRELDEETVSFSNGLMNGKYHRYRDGVLREAGAYDQGKRNGVFTEYYQDGQTVSKITPMKNGKIDGCVKTYFGDGRLASEKEYRQSVENGFEKRYDSQNGTQMLETRWANGKKDGAEWKLTKQGDGVESKVSRTYRMGVLHGAYKEEVLRNGKPILVIEGQYADGERSGVWKEYDATTEKTRVLRNNH